MITSTVRSRLKLVVNAGDRIDGTLTLTLTEPITQNVAAYTILPFLLEDKSLTVDTKYVHLAYANVGESLLSFDRFVVLHFIIATNAPPTINIGFMVKPAITTYSNLPSSSQLQQKNFLILVKGEQQQDPSIQFRLSASQANKGFGALQEFAGLSIVPDNYTFEFVQGTKLGSLPGENMKQSNIEDLPGSGYKTRDSQYITTATFYDTNFLAIAYIPPIESPPLAFLMLVSIVALAGVAAYLPSISAEVLPTNRVLPVTVVAIVFVLILAVLYFFIWGLDYVTSSVNQVLPAAIIFMVIMVIAFARVIELALRKRNK